MITPLPKMRTDIKASAGLLTAHWQQRYGKAGKHIIGYKRNQSANDYPSICYVPIKSKLDQPYGVHAVSLVIGVHEPGITDDVFDGFMQLDAAAELLMPRLLAGGTDWSIEHGLITLTGDLGTRHPFYEVELQFNVIYSPPLDETGMGDFVTFHADYDLEPFAGSVEHEKWLQEPADHTTSAPDLTDTTTLPQ